MSWLRTYAAATAAAAGHQTILDAATPGDGQKPAKTTTIAYRDVLSQLWLLDPVPAWLPGRNHLRQLTRAQKHHLADPALAARLLGMTADALLSGAQPSHAVARDGAFLGHLVEPLVTQSIRVYAQTNDATVHHLRTKAGRHEADLIVERPDKRILAIEVKLARTADQDSICHLPH